MKPLNRRLLIEIIEEEPQQGTFFVPTEERVEDFLPARVGAIQTFGDLSQWHSHVHGIVAEGVFTPEGHFIDLLVF